MTDANGSPATAAKTEPQSPEEVRKNFISELHAGLKEDIRTGVKDSVDEAQKEFKEKLDAFEQRINDIELAKRAGFVPGSHEGNGQDQKMNMGRIVRSLTLRASGDPRWKDGAEMEWEASDQAWEETRAQGTAPDSAGGFLVPGQFFDDQIIPLLRPRLIAQELGAIDLQAVSTPIEIPREGSSPAVDAVAENAANTATDVSFGMVRGEPHTAQSFIKASRRFLTMGTGADHFLRTRMAQEISIEINRWALKGSGAGNEPIGILNAAGVGSVSSTAALNLAAAYTNLLALEGDVDDADALSDAGSPGFAIPNAAFRGLRQLQSQDTTGDHLEFNRKVFSDGAEKNILGHPFRKTTQLTGGGTTTEIVFGDWSKMVLPRWGTVVIEASNTANDAMQRRQTHIVAYMDVDVMILQPSAFSTWTNGVTTGL